mmetsp:Transcript_20801/g.34385  ORF Transcript_20801/g.34385 Transcript_20801/m.34385 type:complete len:154 (+) Transcript_20801:72-533(+)|eukprot:CAMPEP_0119014372 /NCGR_PEP_ID=MMETSP1176-20130426/9620_1 /TAXON_ID=265551 /ORGANISM="Synedropsis recta cf, Strain CCMP1620" /LENGTH=153 /DNA_ID=CAMNT_0006967537 /DNA_START=72 /DNA_END=533 /DNA_ORIENTATION=+
MMQRDENTTKVTIIEPDVDQQQRPCKKRKVSSDDELARALLALKKHSTPPGPLVHPPTFTSSSTRTPPRKILRSRPVVSDPYNTVSDDEEEESVVAGVSCPKQPSANSHTSMKFALLQSPLLLMQSLPPGRPLAAAPRFPRFAPAVLAKPGNQ